MVIARKRIVVSRVKAVRRIKLDPPSRPTA